MQDPFMAAFHQPNMFSNPYRPNMPGFNAGQMIPGMSGQSGNMLSMMMMPFLQQFMGQQGIVGMQFMGQQNLHDTINAQQMMAERQAAIANASQIDRMQFIQQMQGAHRLMGGQGGANFDASAARLGDAFAGIGSVMSMTMPGTYDQLFGRRGSAAVMSQGIYQGSQFDVDPVTGMRGFSPETAGYITRRLHGEFYGSDDAIARMKGMRAGEVGTLYDEMQRRGFMGSADTSANKTIASMSGRLGLESVMPGASATAMREGSVEHAKKKLQDMTGVIAAIRDIFGDAGDPNAPIPALLNGIEALTQGGMSRLDPNTIKNNLRQTQQLARMNAMSLGGTMQVIAQGAGLADQFGLDRGFAQLSANHAMAFAAGAGDVVGFGAMNKEALMSADQQLYMSAAKSPLANQMAAVVGMYNELGGKGKFGDKEFGRMAEAIMRGDSSYEFKGQRTDVAMGWQDVMTMARTAGISEANAAAYFNSTEANQRYMLKYNIPGAVREMQRRDYGGYVEAHLGQQGVGGALAKAITDNLWKTKLDAAKPETWSEALLQGIDPRLLEGIDRDTLKGSIMSGLHLATNTTKVHTIAAQQQFGDEAMARAKRNAAMAANNGAISDALAGLGRGGPIVAITELLMRSNGSESVGELITKVLGGVTEGDLFNQLKNDMTEIGAEIRKAQDPGTSDKDREEAIKKIRDMTGKSSAALEKAVSPQQRAAITKMLAQNDDHLVGRMARATSKMDEKQLRAAIATASPEQRAQLLEGAEAFAGINQTGLSDLLGPAAALVNPAAAPFLELQKSGDAKKFMRETMGEAAVNATGMAPQEVKLSPDTKLAVEGTLKLDKDGNAQMRGTLTPGGGRNSVPAATA